MDEVWDQARVQQYIDDGIEESLNLDYKAAGALAKTDGKRKEITKDVSAMANSDGGTIIYGMSEDPSNRHLPDNIDPINRAELSNDWLGQVIGNIRPRIESLIIHPVTIGNSNTDAAYVVEIPKSHTAHQAMDYRYYKRHNFESVAMEDYEIRDVMNRLKHPRIEVEFKLNKISQGKQEKDTLYDLEISLANTGNVYAQYVVVVVQIDLRLSIVQEFGKQSMSYSRSRSSSGEVATVRLDNTRRDELGVDGSSPRFGPKRYVPILPTLTLKTDSIRVRGSLNDADLRRSIIRWTTYADNAPPIDGKVQIYEIEIVDCQPRIGAGERAK